MSSSDDNVDFPEEEPEIFRPEGIDEDGRIGDSETMQHTEIIAQFNKYTNRPDLLLEVMEKHDPGFIKSMNAESQRFSRNFRDDKFKFGQIQSYTALAVSVLAAVGCLFAVFYLVEKNQAGIGTFSGIAILYTVTQGGPGGFLRIIDGIKGLISQFRGKNN